MLLQLSDTADGGDEDEDEEQVPLQEAEPILPQHPASSVRKAPPSSEQGAKERAMVQAHLDGIDSCEILEAAHATLERMCRVRHELLRVKAPVPRRLDDAIELLLPLVEFHGRTSWLAKLAAAEVLLHRDDAAEGHQMFTASRTFASVDGRRRTSRGGMRLGDAVQSSGASVGGDGGGGGGGGNSSWDKAGFGLLARLVSDLQVWAFAQHPGSPVLEEEALGGESVDGAVRCQGLAARVLWLAGRYFAPRAPTLALRYLVQCEQLLERSPGVVSDSGFCAGAALDREEMHRVMAGLRSTTTSKIMQEHLTRARRAAETGTPTLAAVASELSRALDLAEDRFVAKRSPLDAELKPAWKEILHEYTAASEQGRSSSGSSGENGQDDAGTLDVWQTCSRFLGRTTEFAHVLLALISAAVDLPGPAARRRGFITHVMKRLLKLATSEAESLVCARVSLVGLKRVCAYLASIPDMGTSADVLHDLGHVIEAGNALRSDSAELWRTVVQLLVACLRAGQEREDGEFLNMTCEFARKHLSRSPRATTPFAAYVASDPASVGPLGAQLLETLSYGVASLTAAARRGRRASSIPRWIPDLIARCMSELISPTFLPLVNEPLSEHEAMRRLEACAICVGLAERGDVCEEQDADVWEAVFARAIMVLQHTQLIEALSTATTMEQVPGMQLASAEPLAPSPTIVPEFAHEVHRQALLRKCFYQVYGLEISAFSQKDDGEASVATGPASGSGFGPTALSSFAASTVATTVGPASRRRPLEIDSLAACREVYEFLVPYLCTFQFCEDRGVLAALEAIVALVGDSLEGPFKGLLDGFLEAESGAGARGGSSAASTSAAANTGGLSPSQSLEDLLLGIPAAFVSLDEATSEPVVDPETATDLERFRHLFFFCATHDLTPPSTGPAPIPLSVAASASGPGASSSSSATSSSSRKRKRANDEADDEARLVHWSRADLALNPCRLNTWYDLGGIYEDLAANDDPTAAARSWRCIGASIALVGQFRNISSEPRDPAKPFFFMDEVRFKATGATGYVSRVHPNGLRVDVGTRFCVPVEELVLVADGRVRSPQSARMSFSEYAGMSYETLGVLKYDVLHAGTRLEESARRAGVIEALKLFELASQELRTDSPADAAFCEIMQAKLLEKAGASLSSVLERMSQAVSTAGENEADLRYEALRRLHARRMKVALRPDVFATDLDVVERFCFGPREQCTERRMERGRVAAIAEDCARAMCDCFMNHSPSSSLATWIFRLKRMFPDLVTLPEIPEAVSPPPPDASPLQWMEAYLLEGENKQRKWVCDTLGFDDQVSVEALNRLHWMTDKVVRRQQKVMAEYLAAVNEDIPSRHEALACMLKMYDAILYSKMKACVLVAMEHLVSVTEQLCQQCDVSATGDVTARRLVYEVNLAYLTSGTATGKVYAERAKLDALGARALVLLGGEDALLACEKRFPELRGASKRGKKRNR